MKYKLEEFNRNIPDTELLEDLKRVAITLGTNSLSSREYNDNGAKYTAGTIGVRFGSWNNALTKAGLQLVNQREVSEKDLFKNLEQVWISSGRQPVFRDMKKPASQYSTHWVELILNKIRHFRHKSGGFHRCKILVEILFLIL